MLLTILDKEMRQETNTFTIIPFVLHSRDCFGLFMFISFIRVDSMNIPYVRAQLTVFKTRYSLSR